MTKDEADDADDADDDEIDEYALDFDEMRHIIDEVEVEEVELDVNEQLLFAIQQTEAIDLLLLLDEQLQLVIDIKYIHLHLTEHLLL